MAADSEILKNQLIDIFDQLASFYQIAGEEFRQKTFQKAKTLLKNYQGKIKSGAQMRKNIKGFGKSISDIIDEYIDTGKVERLEELREKYQIKEDKRRTKKPKFEDHGKDQIDDNQKDDDQYEEIIQNFTKYYGIGRKTAERYYSEGFRTPEELLEREKLPSAIRAGIIWHDEITQPIPRKEINQVKKYLKKIFDPLNIKFEIAGSYRRKEKQSGDIDVLIQNKKNISLQDIVEMISDHIVEDLTWKGEIHYRGIFRLKEDYLARRIDLKMINKESWPFAILHYTGSANFNVLCRNRAIEYGLSLSEYALKDKKGNKLFAKTEKEILNFLDIPYIPPEERYRNIEELPTL